MRSPVRQSQPNAYLRLHELATYFAGKDAKAGELFDAFLKLLKRFGPVTVLPEKTRIAFQTRMSFAAVSVRKNYLIGHLVLARRIESPRFLRVETFSPRNHLHAFRIDDASALNDEFAGWTSEAYEVGEQKHLK